MPTKKSARGGWKDVQSKNKAKKQTRLALIVLVIFLSVLFLGWIFKLSQAFFSPFRTSNVLKNYSWNGDFNINILLKGKEIALFSLNPTEKRINIVLLSDKTLVDVPGGFGKWQARAVYDLGKSGEGDYLLKETMAGFFGLPVDAFLHFEGKFAEKNTSEIVDLIRQNPFDIFTLLSNIKTDLSLWELFRLKFEIAGVRFDKIKYFDLVDLGLLDEAKLADGTSVYSFDPVKIDSLSIQLLDSKIQSENKSIAVYNATDKPGLAQKAARIIENLGGNVIIVSSLEERLEKTRISGEKSQTLTRLSQVFNASFDEAETLSRAQISIILGEDFFNRQ